MLLSDRALNNQKLREVVPKAEQLKTRLLEQYTHEYKHCEEQQKLKEMRELEQEKEDKRKQHKNFEITPPVSSPEQKRKTMPGTFFVVMPPVTTDHVRNLDVLEAEKSRYIPKPDCLSSVCTMSINPFEK